MIINITSHVFSLNVHDEVALAVLLHRVECLSELGLTLQHALDLKRLLLHLFAGRFVLGKQFGDEVFLDLDGFFLHLDRLLLVFIFDLAVIDSEVR